MAKTRFLSGKYKLLAIILLLMGGKIFAQSNLITDNKAGIGLAVEASQPIGDFERNYRSGLGGSISSTWNLHAQTQITLSAGYLHFRGKSFEDEYLAYKIEDWEALPVRFGGKYFVTPHFFLKAETGAVFFLEPGKGTALILSPGIGLQLHHFELAAKLETWTDGGTVSYAGFNLGYFF